MTLVYIHGASATGESFNYIREHIGGNDMVINYDSRNGFENNLKSMEEQLRPMKDVFFIGHSLGGIYAIHLANTLYITKLHNSTAHFGEGPNLFTKTHQNWLYRNLSQKVH